MTNPIPPELLTRIREHKQWLETMQKEGQQFVQQGGNLRDLDLSGCDLVDIAISHVNLDKTLLRAANLTDADLYECSFVQAMIDDAQLVQADATRSDFSKASLCRVQGWSAEFMGANLRSANLEGSDFFNADFQRTNLEGANLSYANLRKAYLVKAHLAHAILTGAQMEKTSFVGATGIETAEAEWIEIGDDKVRQRLEGELAKNWLLKATAEQAKQAPPLNETASSVTGKVKSMPRGNRPSNLLAFLPRFAARKHAT